MECTNVRSPKQTGRSITRKGKREVFRKGICVAVIWLLLGSVLLGDTVEVFAEEEPSNLYAQSAVLMDADSGRVLFAKDGQTERAMASTTKIMTCILALEYGNLDAEVSVSAYAASQPKVHLGMNTKQTFALRDLLYSLMLESHNDSAVVIAEAVGGSVLGFADMMNAKAKEIGCENTYFITPNGLDATDENGMHRTTAEDLARIMRYCIMESSQREMFLEITRTSSYQFSDTQGTQHYSCNNHNSFLQMMDGALSGKTGFTATAGYCYVGALRQGERTFIVALLACGWPNHKTYKWTDTKKLMSYALDAYTYQKVWEDVELEDVVVEQAIDLTNPFTQTVSLEVEIQNPQPDWEMLLRDGEDVQATYTLNTCMQAPVKKGEEVGEVQYLLNGEVLQRYPIVATANVQKRTFRWYLSWMYRTYFLNEPI
jgi:D-alanyl-D-alanine carboxypeptidase (penicillin-binding protein 5/6)